MLNPAHLVSTFFGPIALIMSLVLVASLLQRNRKQRLDGSWAMGGMFAAALVLTMSDPIDLGTAGIYDMRNLMIGAAAALLGPKPAVIALLAGVAYRYGLGGNGMVAGIVGMMFAYAGGLLWRRITPVAKRATWVGTLTLGAMISIHLIGILLLPKEVIVAIAMTVAPIMFCLNLLGAAMINHLLNGEMAYLNEVSETRQEARTDHLTGLLNRRGLEGIYPRLYAEALKQKGQALLYFDVDKFKTTNDTFGHAVGDAVLKHVVALVRSDLRHNDTFVRIGGDEFLVLLADVDAKKAEFIAQRCRTAVSDAGFEVACEAVPVTISVGGVWSRHPVAIERLMQAADSALYEAKSNGRNAVVFLTSLGEQIAPRAVEPAA